jgi:hypothetical protein
MKTKNSSPLENDRIKIPMRFALAMGRSKTHLVRVNQGVRKLSIDSAAKAVDLFKKEGQQVTIYQVLPSLLEFKPYFCQGCDKAQGSDE